MGLKFIVYIDIISIQRDVAQFWPKANQPMAGVVNTIYMFYVYFLQSLKNGKYYTGSTEKDPKDRMVEHNQGSNKWTKSNGPFKLVYFEEYFCKSDVIKRETFYKTGFGKRIRNAILREVDTGM